jgi:hypothetical protein
MDSYFRVTENGAIAGCFGSLNKNVMRKIITTYGLIAGAIVSLIWIATWPLHEKGIINFDNGMIVGYTSMVIALSTIFFGIKTHRDQNRNGSIKFLEGLKIGLLITLIASIMYALTWEVYYNTVASDYLEKYSEHYIAQMKTDGATDAELTQAKAEMAESAEMYKNPLVRFGFTLMEIFPVGLLISLISAALLRKRQVLPA